MSNDIDKTTTPTTAIMIPTREMPVATQQEYDGLRLVVSPKEAMRRLDELKAFVKEVMKPGINNDYAVIPGTNKPTLLQPGAQKLCEIYGLAVSYHDVETIKDWDKGFFYFGKRCVLTSRRDGRFICDGVGSCNSKESKYAGRWVNEEDVPAGLDKAHLKSKSRETKRGLWVQYQVPNDDIFSQVNTIEKMACKRALVHAVLTATRSADVFSQDLENIDEDAMGEAETRRSWEKDDGLAEKVKGFEDAIDACQNDADCNRVAAELAKSDVPMREGQDLRKRWAAKKASFAKPAPTAPTTAAPATEPQPAPTKPAATEPEPERRARGKKQQQEPQQELYDPHGDPEPDLPPKREREPGED